MNQKELKELIELLKQQDIAEFELERGDVKVRIKRAQPASPASETRFIPIPAVTPLTTDSHNAAAPPAPPPSPPATPAAAAPEESLHSVRSPIVGTFYESPSPGAPPFARMGDLVEVGQVLCIVEAMKLMNEIESDVAGEIVKKFVSNGQPIEYGQELFGIRPK
ncbi:MAG: acetyl-CoA carboxylase biotin carboxyl carrier protein [Acidobacteria bacterium]|nr:acetyl-CoA carboxylase biotin carboxyl carrier protein [Acidobacteriota bacterium]